MKPPDEIYRLVSELDSLKTGERAASLLGEEGPLAVEPLRRYLLEGVPRKIFHPRLWAVQALSRLGARAVLLEYLLQPREISDPEDKFGEEAVESAAARLLSAWRDEGVYKALLKLSGRKMLIGLIEALASFRRPEAIPYFERALGDDFYRIAAEEAMLELGAAACRAMVNSAVTPQPNSLMETPSSLQRRRSAARVLAKIGISTEDWQILRELLHDQDAELFVNISKLGIKTGSKDDRATITRRILRLLSSAPWYLQGDIEESLILLGADAAARIDEEISRRMKQPGEVRAGDAGLRSLIRVRTRIKEIPA